MAFLLQLAQGNEHVDVESSEIVKVVASHIITTFLKFSDDTKAVDPITNSEE